MGRSHRPYGFPHGWLSSRNSDRRRDHKEVSPSLTILLLVCLILVAPSFAHSLEGRIVNSKTGEGIAGMKITIARSDATFPVTSSADGRFSLDNLNDGFYTASYLT
jgi:hypothetical protein